MYSTIELDDVDNFYNELKNKGVEIKIEIRDKPWGYRHFAIQVPNEIGINIVKYFPQKNNMRKKQRTSKKCRCWTTLTI